MILFDRKNYRPFADGESNLQLDWTLLAFVSVLAFVGVLHQQSTHFFDTIFSKTDDQFAKKKVQKTNCKNCRIYKLHRSDIKLLIEWDQFVVY